MSYGPETRTYNQDDMLPLRKSMTHRHNVQWPGSQDNQER